MGDKQKSTKQGRNTAKCAKYAARHGITKQRDHPARKTRRLSITGIVSGIELPGELLSSRRLAGRPGWRPAQECKCPVEPGTTNCPHCGRSQRPRKLGEHMHRCHNAAVGIQVAI